MNKSAQPDDLVQKSSQIILEFQQETGAYPASPHFKNYQFCWFRDGAFIADAMSRAGHIESAEKFFSWCSRIINDRREHILSGGALDARYNYDGKESTDEWETFQLDGYGTLLWVMKQHAARHQRSIEQYQEAAGLVQHYLATHWQEPCFDWWEERKGMHPASLACIYAGLSAYEHPEAERVHQAINLQGESTDSSLLIIGLTDGVAAEEFQPMLQRIESELVSKDGGVYRYRKDTYYGGGEWPVLTAFLGWYYAKIGKHEKAQQKLAWIQNHIQENGLLAEQVSDNLLSPNNYQPWVERWGEPANPLLWSHAMLIILADELKKYR